MPFYTSENGAFQQSENFHKLLHSYVDKEKLILVLLRSFCVFKNKRKKENSGLEKESPCACGGSRSVVELVYPAVSRGIKVLAH